MLRGTTRKAARRSTLTSLSSTLERAVSPKDLVTPHPPHIPLISSARHGAGAFQQAFLGVPHSLSETSLSRIGQSSASLRTFTPTSAITDGRVPAGLGKDDSEAADANAALQTAHARPLRLSLRSADVPVFKAALKWFYTAGEEDEAFRTVLDGFQDGALVEDEGVTGIQRLREVRFPVCRTRTSGS